MLKETLVADLKSVGNNPKVDQRLARICEGLEKTEKIADAFTYEHVLLRYAEECAEASAALLRYRRALVIGDGSVPLVERCWLRSLRTCVLCTIKSSTRSRRFRIWKCRNTCGRSTARSSATALEKTNDDA